MRNLVDTVLVKIAALDFMRMADVDLGQLEARPAPALSFPAALVTVQSAPFENLSGKVQRSTVQLRIRVAFRVFERTHTLASEEHRAIGLEHFDQLKAINDAIDGLTGEDFTDLKRTNYQLEKRADLRVFQLSYTANYTECIGEPEFLPWGERGGAGDGPEPCITSTIVRHDFQGPAE